MTSWLGRLIHDTKIHRVTRETRDGRAVWVKHRRRGMAPIIAAGGVFLWASNSGIRMFVSTTRWQRWETHCFALVHPDRACGIEGRSGIWQQEVPGQSLRSHLQAGTLTAAMVHAAGGALRRVHALPCPILGEWTHGDPHLGNVLVDDAGVARLIDFETQHDPRRSPAWRRADDLLVFLLELTGRLSAEQGRPLAMAFRDGYGVAEAATLRDRLLPPRGLEKVLWLSRSPGATATTLAQNLRLLRELW